MGPERFGRSDPAFSCHGSLRYTRPASLLKFALPGTYRSRGRPFQTSGHDFMRKYLGRLFGTFARGRSQHLLDIAQLLDFSASDLSQLSGESDDAREELFLSLIEGRHGGPVDWRGTPEDIYDVVVPCLTEGERACLPDVTSVQIAPPARTIESLSSRFDGATRALRAIESFGDFIIVLLVPRERVTEFDRIARSWLA